MPQLHEGVYLGVEGGHPFCLVQCTGAREGEGPLNSFGSGIAPKITRGVKRGYLSRTRCVGCVPPFWCDGTIMLDKRHQPVPAVGGPTYSGTTIVSMSSMIGSGEGSGGSLP